jgi:UDP-galactopyranose mutase
VEGYTALIEALLDAPGIDVVLGEDYLARRAGWDAKARRVIYTGAVDALLGYALGRLAWRSLRFEHLHLAEHDHQGCPTLNECDREVPYLRTEEWRHWWAPAPGTAGTWITRTYPAAAGAPLYPVEDDANRELYARYAALCAERLPHVRLGGRLGRYRYWDMHQALAAALRLVEDELA